MKSLLTALIIAAILLGAWHIASRFELLAKLDNLRLRCSEIIPSGGPAEESSETGKVVVIHFKNGSTMAGELLRKTEDKYYIKYKGEETVVFAEQVARLGSPKDLLKEKTILTDEEITKWWPYDTEMVIRLKNRMVADAQIERVKDDKLTLLYQPKGAGRIEQEIERSQVEYLLFKPVKNRQSQIIEESLKTKFPQMQFYQEGGFTIVTDSYITWVQEYKKTLRDVYTNIYLNFFELFKDKSPRVQNFVVIFDNYIDFVEHAVENGIPGWAVAGYFTPSEKVLYLFNALGEDFSQILFEALVGESGKTIDDIVDTIEGYVDDRYHIFIEGEAKTIKDKYWRAHSYFKGIFREATTSTLRHEFTHELFHNWGLQSIELSKFKERNKELEEEKKGIIKEKDYRKKTELLKSLIFLRKEELDLQAANSWLAEGLATYCETEPIGSRNDRWLYIYQEMVNEGPIYPLEALTQYRMGSFPGVAPKAMLHLYAQSWAFATFLMDKYPEQFIEYQKRLTREIARGYEDINWLMEAIGKDLKVVEKEFVDYMAAYAQVEDPFVSSYMKLHDIFSE